LDRLACVELHALPLQLLLREHPDWAEHPVAVVEHDRPQGIILWINERARRRRLLPGMRHAAALSLAADLRAAVLPQDVLEHALGQLTTLLQGFSPDVEPAPPTLAGTFWLDASGLHRMYPSLAAWSREILDALAAHRLQASVAVGFSRFGCYALAHVTPAGTVHVSPDPEAERRLLRDVPLKRLCLSPRLRDALHKLGVDSVAALERLPPGGLLERFGAEAAVLHALASGRIVQRMARGAGQDVTSLPCGPLQPAPHAALVYQRMDLDLPEADTTRLLFAIKQRLHALLATLAGQHQALCALQLRLQIDPGWAGDGAATDQGLSCTLRPAEPTLDAVQIADLVRLRLEAVARQGQLGRGVTTVELTANGMMVSRQQLQLFVQRPRRDLEAANRALARLRAELGPQAVVHAVLRDRHLPEASFALEPLDRLDPPHPTAGRRQLVRRMFLPGIPCAPGDRQPVAGPFILSGGWWGGEVHREYCYALRGGDLLWLYHDRRRGQWVLQGIVE